MRFEWKPEYGVEVKVIDEQHQKFFSIANSVLDAADENGEDHTQIQWDIFALVDYALYHLTTEEEYFEKFNYDEARDHIAAHDAFRNKMKIYQEAIQNSVHSDKELAAEVARFAGEWLAQHILIMDKKYVACFHRHGLVA